MRRRLVLLVLPILWSCSDTAGPPIPLELQRAVESITAADMLERIGVLSSDAMAGRETPGPGLEAAADYIAGEFEAMGLVGVGDGGGYLQRYPLEVNRLDTANVALGIEGGRDIPVRYGKEYFLAGGSDPSLAGPIVWGGSTADDIIAHNVTLLGTILVVDHPVATYGDPWWSGVLRARQAAGDRGALAVVVILDEAFPRSSIEYLAWLTEDLTRAPPYMGITPALAAELLADAGTSLDTLRAGGPTRLEASLRLEQPRIQESFTPPNVAALLPGSDASRADEALVVMAHYDHLGIGPPDDTGDPIYNGADDNASGTAAMLEIAEAFASMPAAPERPVLFLAVSGEEKGLLGSRYYAAHPTVPGIAGVVNLDMVSRNPYPGVLVGVGLQYTTLGTQAVRRTEDHPELGLAVVQDDGSSNAFFRSDHYSFVEQGVPSIFFTTGSHEDYHRPSDEVGHIDQDKAARVTRLVFYLVDSVAGAEALPAWTEAGRSLLNAIRP